MKVMKVKDKTVNDVTYYKYRINLPKDLVEQLKLFNKQLKILVEKNRLIIEKVN